MATTSIPYGKVILARQEGRSIPSDWGLDAKGRPTEDPSQIAGLHPIAGPKGSGLAMVIDILCSLLSGMAFGPHIVKMYGEMDKRRGLGHFVAAWDIGRVVPLPEFTARLKEMASEMAAIPPAEGFDRVCYPGQIEGERIGDRLANGIPIQPGLWEDLTRLAADYELPTPT
jgi:ureidoglycolate dehydrogenase (NAD+)